MVNGGKTEGVGVASLEMDNWDTECGMWVWSIGGMEVEKRRRRRAKEVCGQDDVID